VLEEIRIYYEGDWRLKPGFHKFCSELHERAKARRCRIRWIDAEGTPCKDFSKAKTAPAVWNILLKDSERPDTGNLSASLCAENGWDKSRADSIFWMVEMMESWFHADKEALARWYGEGFNPHALKRNPNVEQIPKRDLKDGLRDATKNTKKGDYYDDKARHAAKLLELINPALVQEAAPNCRKVFEAVLAKLASA